MQGNLVSSPILCGRCFKSIGHVGRGSNLVLQDCTVTNRQENLSGFMRVLRKTYLSAPEAPSKSRELVRKSPSLAATSSRFTSRTDRGNQTRNSYITTSRRPQTSTQTRAGDPGKSLRELLRGSSFETSASAAVPTTSSTRGFRRPLRVRGRNFETAVARGARGRCVPEDPLQSCFQANRRRATEENCALCALLQPQRRFGALRTFPRCFCFE